MCGCNETYPAMMSGGGRYHEDFQDSIDSYESYGGRKNLGNETKSALYERAKKINIQGRSKMNKQELIEAIRKHYKKVGDVIKKRSRKQSKGFQDERMF